MQDSRYECVVRNLTRVCKGVALFGGAFMLASVAVVTTSVLGGVFGKPLLGDSEIVDRLIGVAVFCFLPYCHLTGGNIVIDFFAKPLPQWAQDALDMIMGLAFAVVAAVMSWRLMVGGMNSFDRNKISMFLKLPEWPVYLVAAVVTVLWVVVIIFRSYEAWRRVTGKTVREVEAA